MRLLIILFFVCAYHLGASQGFVISEGAKTMDRLSPVLTLCKAFEKNKLFRWLHFADTYALSTTQFDSLRNQYMSLFPDSLFSKSVMIARPPYDTSWVAWTIGRLNADRTVTVYGRLKVRFTGTDPALKNALISGIEITRPEYLPVPEYAPLKQEYDERQRVRVSLPPPPPIIKPKE